MTHTPGPWRVEKRAEQDGTIIGYNILRDDEIGEAIAHASEYPYICIDNEDDAKLLAAAPFVKDALRQFLRHYLAVAASGDCGNWDPEEEAIVKLARAALDAAGEPQPTI